MEEMFADEWEEWFEERAALLEYDAGLPRPVAEAEARVYVQRFLAAREATVSRRQA
jgi:hypothetical protein